MQGTTRIQIRSNLWRIQEAPFRRFRVLPTSARTSSNAPHSLAIASRGATLSRTRG